MKIHVLLSPLNVDDLYFTGKTSVVIDVLRATTTIITALQHNAREVIPVNTIEFAMKVSGNAFGGQTLLGGERNTKMIEGFTLGNSPQEYATENIEGKSIILYTTNGSKAIVRAKFSENLFIASFNNLRAVGEHLANLGKDVEILCAGAGGMFCIEDSVCAGRLIDEIKVFRQDLELTDAAKACVVMSETLGSDIYKMLSESEHGKVLIKNGFEEDISYCSVLNNLNVVGSFKTGVIKKIKTASSEQNIENYS